ncbi:hypothetical protein H4R33_002973 [Dimargaris cristalligena]|nr:hypothetical protein H4R33_002973 [Dimargaris cristalligena]
MDTAQEIDNLPPSEALLWFYKEKLERSDAFYHDFELQLDRCKVTQNEYIRTQLELQQRLVEMAELQTTLQKTQEALIQEKQRVFELSKENDGLKIRELEDRKKARYLLSVIKRLESDGSVEYTPASVSRTKRARLDNSYYHSPNPKASPMVSPLSDEMDSIQLQHRAQSLQLRVESLESQLVDQKTHFERLNHNIATQNTNLTQRESLRTKRDAEALQLSREKYLKIHGFYTDNLKEVLKLRKQMDQSDNAQQLEVTRLNSQRTKLESQLSSAEGKLRSIHKTLIGQFESTIADLQRRLEQTNQELLSTQKDQTKTESRLSNKVESLTGQLERIKSSFQSYKTRMYLEVEGSITDCASLYRNLVGHQQVILKQDIPNECAATLLQSTEEYSSRIDRVIQDLNRLKQRCLEK